MASVGIQQCQLGKERSDTGIVKLFHLPSSMHIISEFLIQLELLHWTPELPQRLSLSVGDFLNQCALGRKWQKAYIQLL